jgi:hypothetical protein
MLASIVSNAENIEFSSQILDSDPRLSDINSEVKAEQF